MENISYTLVSSPYEMVRKKIRSELFPYQALSDPEIEEKLGIELFLDSTSGKVKMMEKGDSFVVFSSSFPMGEDEFKVISALL